jgi:predicted glycosyltransferase
MSEREFQKKKWQMPNSDNELENEIEILKAKNQKLTMIIESVEDALQNSGMEQLAKDIRTLRGDGN